jgi:hypothetical protein
MPRGVQSEIIDKIWEHASSIVGETCSKCQQDATEVLNETPNFHRRLWTCHQCGEWWLNQELSKRDFLRTPLETHKQLAQQHGIPDGYELLEAISSPDAHCQTMRLTFRLRPRLSTRLRGPKTTRNLYDHLLDDDW